MNTIDQKEKELLTSAETACLLKINKRTLARLVKEEKLECFRPTEKKTYFTRDMINKYLGL